MRAGLTSTSCLLICLVAVPLWAECLAERGNLRVVRVPAVVGQLWAYPNFEPLRGATVSLLRNNDDADTVSTTTDERGLFSFDVVAYGDYGLFWKAAGYQWGQLSVTVSKGLPHQLIAIRAVEGFDQGTCNFTCVVLGQSTARRTAPNCLKKQ